MARQSHDHDRPATERGVDRSVNDSVPGKRSVAPVRCPGGSRQAHGQSGEAKDDDRPAPHERGKESGLQVNHPGIVMPRRLRMVGKMMVGRRPDRSPRQLLC